MNLETFVVVYTTFTGQGGETEYETLSDAISAMKKLHYGNSDISFLSLEIRTEEEIA